MRRAGLSELAGALAAFNSEVCDTSHRRVANVHSKRTGADFGLPLRRPRRDLRGSSQRRSPSMDSRVAAFVCYEREHTWVGAKTVLSTARVEVA